MSDKWQFIATILRSVYLFGDSYQSMFNEAKLQKQTWKSQWLKKGYISLLQSPICLRQSSSILQPPRVENMSSKVSQRRERQRRHTGSIHFTNQCEFYNFTVQSTHVALTLTAKENGKRKEIHGYLVYDKVSATGVYRDANYK